MAAETEATADYASELPEHVMHHILSFLLDFSPEQAAQTSVLNKAWLRAWRTRPSLNLWFRVNPKSGETDIQVLEKRRRDFISCIDTTLHRYHEHKHGIHSLELRFPSVSPDQISRWIGIAGENGVKSLKIDAASDDPMLLPQTVFEAKSLAELFLCNFKLKPQEDWTIRCHNLRKLWLFQVELDEAMFERILSSCPLIYLLTIIDCVGLANLKVTKLQKLELLTITSKGSCYVEVEAPSLRDFEYGDAFSGWNGVKVPSGHRRLQMHMCPNLKRMRLYVVGVTDEFFLEIAEKFPHLEELGIKGCDDLERIRISSHSIKCLKLDLSRRLKEAQIDVPSIGQFEFRGEPIPLVFSTAPSGPWVSKIHLLLSGWSNGSSFFKMKDLLTNLSQSVISLRLNFYGTVGESIVDEIRNGANLPLPQVQKLSLQIDEECVDDVDLILDSVFWTCHPKTITQKWNSCLRPKHIHLAKRLLLRGHQKHINLNQTKFWQDDLKDVKVVIFKEGQRMQLPPGSLDWDTLLEEFPPTGYDRKLRYELEWETQEINWKQTDSRKKLKKIKGEGNI